MICLLKPETKKPALDRRHCNLMEALMLLKGAQQALDDAVLMDDGIKISGCLAVTKDLEKSLEEQMDIANRDSLIHRKLIDRSQEELTNSRAKCDRASSLLSSSFRLLM